MVVFVEPVARILVAFMIGGVDGVEELPIASWVADILGRQHPVASRRRGQVSSSLAGPICPTLIVCAQPSPKSQRYLNVLAPVSSRTGIKVALRVSRGSLPKPQLRDLERRSRCLGCGTREGDCRPDLDNVMQVVKPQIAGHLNAPHDNRLDMVEDDLETHHRRRGSVVARKAPFAVSRAPSAPRQQPGQPALRRPGDAVEHIGQFGPVRRTCAARAPGTLPA